MFVRFNEHFNFKRTTNISFNKKSISTTTLAAVVYGKSKLNWSLIFGVSLIVGGCYYLYEGTSLGGVVLSQQDVAFNELNRLCHLAKINPVNLIFNVLELSNQQLLDAAVISRFYGLPIGDCIELVNYMNHIGQYNRLDQYMSDAALIEIFGVSDAQLGSNFFLQELREILENYDLRFNVRLPGNGHTVAEAFTERINTLSPRRG